MWTSPPCLSLFLMLSVWAISISNWGAVAVVAGHGRAPIGLTDLGDGQTADLEGAAVDTFVQATLGEKEPGSGMSLNPIITKLRSTVLPVLRGATLRGSDCMLELPCSPHHRRAPSACHECVFFFRPVWMKWDSTRSRFSGHHGLLMNQSSAAGSCAP